MGKYISMVVANEAELLREAIKRILSPAEWTGWFHGNRQKVKHILDGVANDGNSAPDLATLDVLTLLCILEQMTDDEKLVEAIGNLWTVLADFVNINENVGLDDKSYEEKFENLNELSTKILKSLTFSMKERGDFRSKLTASALQDLATVSEADVSEAIARKQRLVQQLQQMQEAEAGAKAAGVSVHRRGTKMGKENVGKNIVKGKMDTETARALNILNSGGQGSRVRVTSIGGSVDESLVGDNIVISE